MYLSKIYLTISLICLSVISFCQSNYLPVKIGSHWGYIDKIGNVKISGNFTSASDFFAGAAKVHKGENAFLIDTLGNRISPLGIDNFRQVGSVIIFTQNNMMGVCTYTGKMIAEPVYSSVVETSFPGIFQIGIDNSFGLINEAGRLLVSIEYESIHFSESVFWCSTKSNGYYNFYLPKTDQYIEGDFQNIRLFDRHVFVQNADHWTLINDQISSSDTLFWEDVLQITDGYYLGISPEDTTLYYGDSFIRVGSNLGLIEASRGVRLVVNQQRKRHIIQRGILDEVAYDFIDLKVSQGCYVLLNGYANYLDSSLNPTYPWKYSAIEPIEQGFAKVYDNKGVGLINCVSQSEVIQPRFTSLNVYGSRIKAYSQNNTLWLFSIENGKIADSIEFSNFSSIRTSFVQVSTGADVLNPRDTGQVVRGRWHIVNNLWGLKDRDGKQLIKPFFSSYEQIAGTAFTIVTKRSYNSTTGSIVKTRLGLVNEETGKIIIQPNCTYFDREMLRNPSFSVVRVRSEYGAFNLYDKNTGKSKRLVSPFIDEYINGRARIYLGGKLSYTESPSTPSVGYAANFLDKYGYSLGTGYVRMQRFIQSKYKAKRLQVYAVGGQWNYVDRNGNLLLPVYKYSYSKISFATSFDPTNAVVYRSDSCALINRNGRFLTPYSYKSIVKTTDSDSSAYKVSKLSASYNYYTKNGAKIGNVFEYGSDLNNGAAWIKMDKEFHILTEAGNIVKPQENGIPFRNKFNDGYSPVQVNRNWTVIDTSGEFQFEPRSGKIIWSSQGFSAIRDRTKLKNGKSIRGYTVLDNAGNKVGSSIYSKVYPYKNDFAVVRLANRKIGFIDTEGNLIHSRRYSRMSSFDKNGLSVVRKNGNGVVNTEGKMVVPARFSKVIVSDSTIVAQVGKRLCIFDFDGRKLASIRKVDRYSGFENGLAMIRRKNSVGYIDPKGNYVIPPIYKSGSGFEQNTALIRNKNKQCIIDQDQNILSEYPYKERMVFSEGILIRYTSSGYRYYNAYGKLISPKYYMKARPFKNGYAIVMHNYKWGVIDRTGKEILPCEFMSIRINELGEISAQKSISFGLIDVNGADIVTPTYDSIHVDTETNLYKLQYGVVPSYLTMTGDWVWK